MITISLFNCCKKIFFQSLQYGRFTSADYAYAKKFFQDFEIKNLREFYDLYIQREKLFLTDVFENF